MEGKKLIILFGLIIGMPHVGMAVEFTVINNTGIPISVYLFGPQIPFPVQPGGKVDFNTGSTPLQGVLWECRGEPFCILRYAAIVSAPANASGGVFTLGPKGYFEYKFATGGGSGSGTVPSAKACGTGNWPTGMLWFQ
jgi:hypothetical protein